jgi:site-specific DNA-adenine methylase
MSEHPSILDAVVGDSTTHPIPHVLYRVPATCRSCLKSGGGKHLLTPILAAMRPGSRIFAEFREPFASSAALSFHVVRHGLAKKVWINDLDPHVANFWMVLRDHPVALVRRVQALRDKFGLGSIALFKLASVMVDHPDPIESAAGFFVRNRIAYGGTNGKSSFNPSYPRLGRGLKQVFIDRLWQFSTWLQGVTITSLDYKEVVSAPGEDVFIFFDPPYSNAGDVTYRFGSIDIDDFAEVVKQSPHACLLTVNDCQANRQRFAGMHPVLRRYASSMGRHKDSFEIIAANYSTPLYLIYARQIGTPLWLPGEATNDDWINNMEVA